MRGTLRPLAALAMLALISTGCSNAPASAGGTGSATAISSASTAAADTGSATAASSGGSTTATGGSNNAANRQQAVKFAACMRANGVKGFPDPDASGELTIDSVANGSSLDTNSAAFKQALSACKDLEPPGFTGGKRSPEQEKAALKFAQCMRDNGVKDFPDPTDTGPLINVNGAQSIPGFQAAVGKCRAYLAGALGGQ